MENMQRAHNCLQVAEESESLSVTIKPCELNYHRFIQLNVGLGFFWALGVMQWTVPISASSTIHQTKCSNCLKDTIILRVFYAINSVHECIKKKMGGN